MKIEKVPFDNSHLFISAGKYEISIGVENVVENLNVGDYIVLCVEDDVYNEVLIPSWLKSVEDENHDPIENPMPFWEIVKGRAFEIISKVLVVDGYHMLIEPEDVHDENDDIYERLCDYSDEINGL